ncbi:MAG: spondin domain-containing protein [Desulfobacterales bacterium]|nr:spondin domain-containing protein [Desulfobacterales bacterium]
MKCFKVMVFALFFLSTFCFNACTVMQKAPMAPVIFTVTIENISDSSAIPTPLAPGVWAVHTSPYVLYKATHPDMGMGLEPLAEDGMPNSLYAHVMTMKNVGAAGIFDTPSDMDKPGPLMPGASYSFTVMGMPGDRLSFATMFVQSNDLFFGTMDQGVPLFRGETPISGDYTPQVMLWDAGTEINEAPGKGMYQAPRQMGPGMGAPEHGNVRLITDGYPPSREMIRITIKNSMHTMDKMTPMPGHGSHSGH